MFHLTSKSSSQYQQQSLKSSSHFELKSVRTMHSPMVELLTVKVNEVVEIKLELHMDHR